MSLKIANLRLELDEPEAALADKLSARLGVPAREIARWRILRKSLDARRHDDLHFVYAAAVERPARPPPRPPAPPSPPRGAAPRGASPAASGGAPGSAPASSRSSPTTSTGP